ncbi:MAG: hypothetical protein JWP61_2960 [Friedmanniella sp.]|nr:hypothetical protein [Friedmanniella sp.]
MGSRKTRLGHVSDIPVGSPPTPSGRHAAPGGWYPDPAADGQERYWDGWQWSRNTRPAERAEAPRPGPTGSTPLAPLPPGARAVATADGVRLAGWWWRALAATVDSLLISLIITPVTLAVYRPTIEAMVTWFRAAMAAASAGGQPPPTPDVTNLVSASDQFLVIAATLVVGMAFHVLFLRWRGATPGKLLCGMRVVPVDRGRSTERLGWATVVIRAAVWVVPNASSLLTLVRIADVLFPLWQPRRQSLHDLAARTQVIRPLR